MRRAAGLGLALALAAGLALLPGAAGAAVPHLAPRVYAGGGVLGFGDAAAVNAPQGAPLSSVMVALAPNPAADADHQGYWLAGADGGVFAEGNAGFYGSTGALHLTGPVVGMAATPDGRGYWLAALDGGIFAFGDAGFHGSMGGTPLNQPIVGMAATPDGGGYWLVASDGGIFAFGDATFHGSTGGLVLNEPVTGMAATDDGGGYVLVASDGGVFTFGDAPFEGSLAGGLGGDPADVPPVAGIAFTPDGRGYWLLEPDGWSYGFTNPPSPDPTPTGSAVVAIAAAQVNADPTPGNFCNPYGPCEEWCALFATWVWQQAGVPIPSYAFTGDIDQWAQANTGVLPAAGPIVPGDAVLYGTGPWSTATSLHVGLVVQTWPDGAVVTVEGDAGPAPVGSLAVIVNGPYLPADSETYNGMPVYAVAEP